jgi:hypothetical protein
MPVILSLAFLMRVCSPIPDWKKKHDTMSMSLCPENVMVSMGHCERWQSGCPISTVLVFSTGSTPDLFNHSCLTLKANQNIQTNISGIGLPAYMDSFRCRYALHRSTRIGLQAYIAVILWRSRNIPDAHCFFGVLNLIVVFCPTATEHNVVGQLWTRAGFERWDRFSLVPPLSNGLRIELGYSDALQHGRTGFRWVVQTPEQIRFCKS